MPLNDQTPNVIPIDSNENPLPISSGAAVGLTKALLVAGSDNTGVARLLQAAADGRLIVSTLTVAPAGTTAVNRFADGNIGALATVETVYIITNGKTLTIQSFGGGAATSNAGARVELVERPTGLPASDVVVDVGYANGNNFQFLLSRTFVGDGTRQIVLKRINSGGSPTRAAAKWSGYEQ